MIDTKPQNAMPPARLHAILARHGAYAVVFRRGPSDKVAVVGWDRSNDTFTLGQWLRGRIYPLRCDLSPSGKHLIYFAAKYGRENPVEKRICEELKKRFKTVDIWRVDHRLLTQAEDELRRKKEFQKLEKSFSKSGNFRTVLSIRWGASPAGNYKYVKQIPNPVFQKINQSFRTLKIPGNNWRVNDPGHIHIIR